jgi:hypothetical protein
MTQNLKFNLKSKEAEEPNLCNKRSATQGTVPKIQKDIE